MSKHRGLPSKQMYSTHKFQLILQFFRSGLENLGNECSCHVDSCQSVDEGMKKCNRQRGQVFQSNSKVKISDQKQIFLVFFPLTFQMKAQRNAINREVKYSVLVKYESKTNFAYTVAEGIQIINRVVLSLLALFFSLFSLFTYMLYMLMLVFTICPFP